MSTDTAKHNAFGLLSQVETCELLRISRSLIYNLRRRRVDPLPSILLGRWRRYREADILAWLSRQYKPSGYPAKRERNAGIAAQRAARAAQAPVAHVGVR